MLTTYITLMEEWTEKSNCWKTLMMRKLYWWDETIGIVWRTCKLLSDGSITGCGRTIILSGIRFFSGGTGKCRAANCCKSSYFVNNSEVNKHHYEDEGNHLVNRGVHLCAIWPLFVKKVFSFPLLQLKLLELIRPTLTKKLTLCITLHSTSLKLNMALY